MKDNRCARCGKKWNEHWWGSKTIRYCYLPSHDQFVPMEMKNYIKLLQNEKGRRLQSN